MFHNIYQGKRSIENRPETIRNLILWAAGLLFAGYQVINIFVPNREMIVYTRILDASATSVALYIFAKDAWLGVLRKRPLPRDFLICGIWLKFFSAWLIGVYAIVYRLAGEPQWLFNNELLSPIIMVSVVAVVLHVATPGTVDGIVPRRNQYALGSAFGLTVLLIGFLIAAKPDIRPYIEPLRPYIADWWKTGEARAPERQGRAPS